MHCHLWCSHTFIDTNSRVTCIEKDTAVSVVSSFSWSLPFSVSVCLHQCPCFPLSHPDPTQWSIPTLISIHEFVFRSASLHIRGNVSADKKCCSPEALFHTCEQKTHPYLFTRLCLSLSLYLSQLQTAVVITLIHTSVTLNTSSLIEKSRKIVPIYVDGAVVPWASVGAAPELFTKVCRKKHHVHVSSIVWNNVEVSARNAKQTFFMKTLIYLH